MNILITGAGGPAAICVFKALQNQGYIIHMADMDANAAGLYLVEDKQQFIVPAAMDPEFVNAVLNICTTASIDLLIPTVDKEFMPIAKHIQQFNNIGCKVMLSATEALSVCLDKYLLMKACENKVALASFKTLEQFLERPDVEGKKWIIKPRSGAGSRGVQKIDSINQLSGLSALLGKNFMVQEYLEGKEYSIDVMIDNKGTVCAAVARERMKTDSGIAVTSKVVKKQAIIDYAIKAATAIKLHYAANVQVIDTIGGPRLLEINPRFSGGLSLVVAAGVNTPLMCVENIMKNKTFSFINSYKELAMVRYYEEKFFEPERFLHSTATTAIQMLDDE